MRKQLLAVLAAVALLANTSAAQLDLGGAVSGAINGATGNTQAAAGSAANAGANVGANVGVPGSNVGAGLNAAGNVNQNAGQSWLGRVGSDIRGALQQADNGVMRLQNNLNPSLQQYGFQPGDQLLGSNGQPLNQAQFDQYLQSNPNQLRVLRNGQTVTLNGNLLGNSQLSGQGNVQSGVAGGMSASGRQRFGITMSPSGEGVLVSGVTVGSPAAQAGIRPGDQIIALNGQTVANPNAMIQLVGAASANQALDVQFRRNGQVMQSQVTLAANNNMSGGVRQAGYAQGMSGRFQGQARGDVHARLDQLERMIQDLSNQVQQLNGSQSASAQKTSDAPAENAEKKSDSR